MPQELLQLAGRGLRLCQKFPRPIRVLILQGILRLLQAVVHSLLKRRHITSQPQAHRFLLTPQIVETSIDRPRAACELVGLLFQLVQLFLAGGRNPIDAAVVIGTRSRGRCVSRSRRSLARYCSSPRCEEFPGGRPLEAPPAVLAEADDIGAVPGAGAAGAAGMAGEAGADDAAPALLPAEPDSVGCGLVVPGLGVSLAGCEAEDVA